MISPIRLTEYLYLILFVFLFSVFLTCLRPNIVSAAVVNLGGSSGTAEDACSWGSNGGKYCLLAPLGNYIGQNGVLDVAGGGLSAYLKALFSMGIVLATGLAVIMIAVGGLKYVSTDAINGKSEGKEMIQQALLGLVLALMAVIILRQVNPKLLNSDFKVKGGDVITGSIDIVEVDLQKADAVTKEYQKGENNSMIDTSGVTYVELAGGGVKIGEGGASIDYDGSPGAYRVVEDPNGLYTINGKRYRSVGDDYLANARSDDLRWVGVETDKNGEPIINSDGTLNPQLSYGGGKINGNITPFAALSTDQVAAAKKANPNFGLGSTVYLSANGRTIEAIYADNAGNRPDDHAEISPAAAKALGIGFTKDGTTGSAESSKVTITLP